MVASVAQYMLAVKHLDKMSRTLGDRDIHPIYDARNSDRPLCSVGNSVVVFQVTCKGKRMAMRVYMCPHHNLRAIYGDKYYPKELLINSSDTEYCLADVVLCDWYEGVSLQSKIEEFCCKPVKMAALSRMFEDMALSILSEHWAHGDIKPENIIFSTDGLHLIDFDAMYRDGFSADDCVEIGTRQFQHPLRDRYNFGRDIDDYPIALITTALAALSMDSRLGLQIKDSDYLLISPSRAVDGSDETLQYIESLFAESGDVRHYRIAKLLHSPHPSLPTLISLLGSEVRLGHRAEELTLEYYNGYWGFAAKGVFVIPPLYDLAFDFSEGLALVRVGDVWHFIDAAGDVAITCGRGVGIKPFSGGVSHINRDDGTFVIYRDGRVKRV